MRRFGLVGFLIGALLLGGVGVTAYQMGVTAGTTSAAVTAGATVVYAAPGIGFGFPFFGLLFGLLFLALVIGFFKRMAWARSGGPGGPGGHGPGRGPWMMHGAWGHGGPGGWNGGWGPGTDRPVPPPVADMLGRWHEQAHGTAPTGQTGSTGQAGSATGQAPSDGPTGSTPA